MQRDMRSSTPICVGICASTALPVAFIVNVGSVRSIESDDDVGLMGAVTRGRVSD